MTTVGCLSRASWHNISTIKPGRSRITAPLSIFAPPCQPGQSRSMPISSRRTSRGAPTSMRSCASRRVTPSVIVHRGHSTYVAQTIEKVPATVALVYLGNCGGYTLLETILKKAPKAHILTTKGIGTLTINDPLLKALNDYLLRGKDMTWQSFWRQAEATLGRNPRFMDYVPPDKKAGAVFLTAYRSFMTTK